MAPENDHEGGNLEDPGKHFRIVIEYEDDEGKHISVREGFIRDSEVFCSGCHFAIRREMIVCPVCCTNLGVEGYEDWTAQDVFDPPPSEKEVAAWRKRIGLE